MLGTTSAETQKWFDQNHTSRSTKPISASIAASMRALTSRLTFCCGGVGCGGAGGSGTAIVAASSGFGSSIGVITAVAALRCSSLMRDAMRFACCSWL